MSLSNKQQKFTILIARLVLWAEAQGYGLTFGDAYRDPLLAQEYDKLGKGIKNSLHSRRLAVDFNLFREGHYLPRSGDYALLGEYWKSLDPLNRWGGDFRDSKGNPAPDGNHFSMEDGGIK